MSHFKHFMARLSGKLVKYFLRGILITLPLAAIVWIVYWAVTTVDDRLGLHEYHGLGLVIILVGLTIIGFIGSWFLLKPILDIIDDLLERVPGIKVIYTLIKDFLEAFVGEKRKFSEPVAVEMNNGLYKLGFVTQKKLDTINFEGFVAVYFPHSYNFSGNVFLVPVEKIKYLDGNASDIMKFIVTGGVTEFEESRKTEKS